MQHDGISVACYILPAAFFGICLILIHVVSGVALNLSASLQKDSVAPARFLTQFAEFTVEGCDTLESAISALIQRKSATFLWRVATGM
ncbi:hypothetical protein A5906_36970 [Bradyrhizobium sacchari]|uniref:hypothetical protein n=1 Tax=Bradyrhizobium sacchari TaxID=1399419 RepID=UPI0009B084A8|nr:hypothetical protein [Bradyrhizobium sacchari]OPY97843.1 hypothetical protein A5906_36970 [Bradyrhizobium sacchari]